VLRLRQRNGALAVHALVSRIEVGPKPTPKKGRRSLRHARQLTQADMATAVARTSNSFVVLEARPRLEGVRHAGVRLRNHDRRDERQSLVRCVGELVHYARQGVGAVVMLPGWVIDAIASCCPTSTLKAAKLAEKLVVIREFDRPGINGRQQFQVSKGVTCPVRRPRTRSRAIGRLREAMRHEPPLAAETTQQAHGQFGGSRARFHGASIGCWPPCAGSAPRISQTSVTWLVEKAGASTSYAP
jgi:hypothetical protein